MPLAFVNDPASRVLGAPDLGELFAHVLAFDPRVDPAGGQFSQGEPEVRLLPLIAGETGFEPATYRSQSERSSRLSYSPF